MIPEPNRDPAKTPDGSADWRGTFAVFGVALAVRLIYLYESSDSPAFALPLNDSEIYDHLATALLTKGEMGWRFFYQGVFYPLYLTSVYFVFGQSIVAAKVVQAVLGAVTAALVQRYGSKCWGAFVGGSAGIITALYGPLVFFEVELLATGFAAFFSIALLWIFSICTEKPTQRRFIALGVLAGLSILTRAVFLPFFLVAATWLFVRLYRTTERIHVPGILAMALGCLIVTLPVGIASHRITHRFAILPFSGGVNLYLGNNGETCDTLTLRPGKDWNDMINRPLKHGLVNPWDKEAFYTDKFFDYVKNDPLRYAGGLARKALLFVNSREIPRSFDLYSQHQWSSFLKLSVWKIKRFGFPFGLLFALSVIGIAYRFSVLPTPLRLLLVLYPLSVIAVFVTARYRVPLVPVLSLTAALGLEVLIDTVRRRSPGKIAEVVMACLTALLLSVVPPTFCEEKIDLEAEMYFMAAAAHAVRGNTGKASACYRKSITLNPDYYEALETFGVFLNEREKIAESIPILKNAVRLQPRAFNSLLYLGKSLGQRGRFQEGEAYLRRALKEDPASGYAHSYLGICLANQGKMKEAHHHLKTAVERLPNHELSKQNLKKVKKILSGSTGAPGAADQK